MVTVVTTNDLPGYQVEAVFGEVFGVTVRSRNLGSNIGASFRSIVGGEVGAYVKLVTETRDHAVARLRDAAEGMGANAVLMMRFDSSEIAGSMNEVVAYGTAVRVSKK
jgi:uncharacterized protein YbjQ (UPF0145 family)